MSVRINLRGMLRLIRVDHLRGVHNVGLLVGRLIYKLYKHAYFFIKFKRCVVYRSMNTAEQT